MTLCSEHRLSADYAIWTAVLRAALLASTLTMRTGRKMVRSSTPPRASDFRGAQMTGRCLIFVHRLRDVRRIRNAKSGVGPGERPRQASCRTD